MEEIKCYDNNSLVLKDGKNIVVKYIEIEGESENFKSKNFRSLRVAKEFAKLKNKKYLQDFHVRLEEVFSDETKREQYKKYYEYVMKKILRNSYYGYVPKMSYKEYKDDDILEIKREFCWFWRWTVINISLIIKFIKEFNKTVDVRRRISYNI